MSVAIVEAHNGMGDHCPLLLYADTDGELAQQAEQYGGEYHVLSARADGVIDRSGMEEAEIDESPTCACCMTPASKWEHR